MTQDSQTLTADEATKREIEGVELLVKAYKDKGYTAAIDVVLKSKTSAQMTFAAIIAALEMRDEAKQNTTDLLDALAGLVEIINKAGLSNLSNGVQLGQMSWHVKASDRLRYAEEVLSRAALNQGQG